MKTSIPDFSFMGKTIHDWVKELDPDEEVGQPYSVMKFAAEWTEEREAILRKEQADYDDTLFIFKEAGQDKLVALGDGFIIELY